MNYIKMFALLIISSITLLSCDGDYTFKDYKTFTKKRWYNDNVVHLEFNNKDNVKTINPELLFRFVKGTQVDKMSVKYTVTSPSGQKFDEVINFNITREGCLGDICDLSIPIKKSIKLETGKYSFDLTILNPGEFTPNIMYVGIIMEK